jgi:hypothetical protein
MPPSWLPGAEALRGLVKGDDGVERYCQQIFEHKTEANEVAHEVLMAPRQSRPRMQ